MDTSFMYFWEGIFQNPMLLISALFTLGVIFVNGWTDAPNAIATCVTTRCLRPRQAIMMSAVFNFLGVFVMTQINSSVASTISNMVDFGANTHNALIALCAALFSIVVYSVAASFFGIPTSESHSLIAGLTGAAIAIQNSTDGINGAEWVKVLYGLVLSLVLGFLTGWVVCKIITILFQNMERKTGKCIFPLRADRRCGGHEFHARRAGWAEVYRCSVPGHCLCGRSEFRGRYDHSGMADAALQYRHGSWNQRGR